MTFNNFQMIPADIGNLRLIITGQIPFGKMFGGDISLIHSHPHYELHYVVSGCLRFQSEEDLELEAGELLLIPPGCRHGCDDGTSRRLVFSIALTEGAGQSGSFSEYRYYRELFSRLKEPFRFRSEPAAAILEELMQLHGNEMSFHKMQILLAHFFIRMAECIRSLQEPQIDRPLAGAAMSDEERRWYIRNYIDINYAKAGAIDTLAEQMNLCRRQTDRVIRRLFGESAQTLIRRRRMEAAALMLTDSDIGLGEIARRVGYESYTGFYWAVREAFGCTPEELRHTK